MVVDDQVGVFANVNRADTLVNAKLDGRIERHQLERFELGEAAVLHGLGGFLVQVRGFLGVVGVD